MRAIGPSQFPVILIFQAGKRSSDSLSHQVKENKITYLKQQLYSHLYIHTITTTATKKSYGLTTKWAHEFAYAENKMKQNTKIYK